MSAYIVAPAHISAMLRVAYHGPADPRPVRPDNRWTRPTWYASDPRAVEYGPSNPTAYFRDLEMLRRSVTNPDEIREAAAMLERENARSVSYRYSEPERLMPGPVDAADIMRRPSPLIAAHALSAIAGYEYQACEHPSWRASEAFAFCDALRHSLIRALPEYDSGPWTIDDETPAPRAEIRA